jgi:hypothetical protein
MKPLAGKKKIVRSSEVQDNENKLREEVIALGDDIVESPIKCNCYWTSFFGCVNLPNRSDLGPFQHRSVFYAVFRKLLFS